MPSTWSQNFGPKGGIMLLQSGDKSIKPKEVPIDVFFQKIVMARDRLRVLEQQINGHKGSDNNDGPSAADLRSALGASE